MGNTTASLTHEQLFGGGVTSSGARFVDPASIPVDEVRERLKRQCAYKPMYEINFIISKDSKIACFWEKRFYITDDSFTPELVYETESFANAVSLSDSSKYAIFQTAYNAKNDEDSGAFAIIDVEKREVINKGAIETGWKGMTHLYIDEDKKCFWVYYGNERVKYGFDLSPDAKTLEQYEEKAELSPYYLLEKAQSCIDELKETYTEQAERKAVGYLSRSASDPKMSTYQLSNAYKELGQIYDQNELKQKALDAYREGLRLNPALSVKKRIKQLEKELNA